MKTCFWAIIFSLAASSLAVADASFGTHFQFYGFVKPQYSYGSNALSSFGASSGTASSLAWSRVNQVAVTEAAPHLSPATDEKARSSFNVSQTRFGVNAEVMPRVLSGTIEMDFIDFDKSASTTALRPRLRVAKAVWHLSDDDELTAGQDWDLIAPPKPHTFDFVGLFFRAGNLGFMRQQITYRHQQGAFQYAAMVGGNGINDASNDSAVERTLTPTFAARVAAKSLDGKLTTALNGIFNRRRFESPTDAGNAVTRASFGATLSADWQATDRLSVHGNSFWGQNLNATGSALTLVSGSRDLSLKEWGGFLTGRFDVSERHGVFGGGGTDQTLRGYDASLGSLVKNTVARAGYVFHPVKALQVYGELSEYWSQYNLPAGLSSVDATGAEVGMVLTL